MAKTIKNLLFFSTLILLLSSAAPAFVDESERFYKEISSKSLGVNFEREKLSHFHFYLHDTFSGSHPSAIPVAEASSTNNSKTFFGREFMMDDPLTTGPGPNSTVIGRAQGIFASASQTEVSFLMALNYVFTQGKYNGSTLSVLGRNNVVSGVREMPIVGGSGLFQFARGYALAKTHEQNFKTGDGVVEQFGSSKFLLDMIGHVKLILTAYSLLDG